ncbi:MAG: amino acid transporter [Desulfobacula sp.]|nr:amino acid transporter [Desulfobacula sp.]
MITPFIQGFGTGGGLIVAIGAQNAFVLSQGVRRNHHFIIALICIICDAVFITAGVAGFGTAVSTNPALYQWVAWGGSGFLFFYGLRSLCSAIRGGSMDISDQSAQTLRAAILTTLAVTLLNPHFYLDTVILLGSVSGQFHGESRLYFWVGAVSASTLWFISLCLGGQMLAPLFKKQISWRILDSLVCATMWTIAVSLLIHKASV